MTEIEARQLVAKATDKAPEWVGVPPQGFLLRRSDALLIPFSLLWCGMVLLSVFVDSASKEPLLARLVRIAFVLIGLYLVAGRFFFDAWQRNSTAYGISGGTVVIVRKFPFYRIQLVSLVNAGLTFEGTRGGAGTIYFGAPPENPDLQKVWPTHKMPPYIELRSEARALFDRLLTIQGSSVISS